MRDYRNSAEKRNSHAICLLARRVGRVDTQLLVELLATLRAKLHKRGIPQQSLCRVRDICPHVPDTRY
jgi:hypothetical protein